MNNSDKYLYMLKNGLLFDMRDFVKFIKFYAENEFPQREIIDDFQHSFTADQRYYFKDDNNIVVDARHVQLQLYSYIQLKLWESLGYKQDVTFDFGSLFNSINDVINTLGFELSNTSISERMTIYSYDKFLPERTLFLQLTHEPHELELKLNLNQAY